MCPLSGQGYGGYAHSPWIFQAFGLSLFLYVTPEAAQLKFSSIKKNVDLHEENLKSKAESDNNSNNDPKNNETLQEMNEPIPGNAASPASPASPKPNIYRRYADHWSCYDCDAKGDRYYLEKHQCKGQTDNIKDSGSKLADIAAANLSGNGIMEYNSDNNNGTNRCPDAS